VIVKYAVEVASGSTIYIPSFIKIDSSVQKSLLGRYAGAHTQNCDLMGLVLFFKIRKVG
jgi:hypothetical protein